MQLQKESGILVEKSFIRSKHLGREVIVDLYIPVNGSNNGDLNLLLINDGQDLHKFHFSKMLGELSVQGQIKPLLCVGIHCGAERRMEYGTASVKDFNGRGAKAALHKRFVFEELMPFINKNFTSGEFKSMAYAGFSLGGLTAIDVAWSHPEIFSKTGVFSGSLWWRLKDLDEGYNEDTDRIIHKLVREGEYKPGLQFYFTTGSLDEKIDRNANGIIDSIDDTLGLIKELESKGYKNGKDIKYINYETGRHDVFTWGKAMPDFLKWGWGVDA